MTSEAIDVSGVKVFIFVIGRGSGMACRCESGAVDTNEPDDISMLKPGKTTAKKIDPENASPLSFAGVRHAIGYPKPTDILDRCVRSASPAKVRQPIGPVAKPT
jgi:hypothetical protein